MAERDVRDAQPLIDRIGKSLDELSAHGYPAIHGILAIGVRERRGQIRRLKVTDRSRWAHEQFPPSSPPLGPIKDLFELAESLENLIEELHGEEPGGSRGPGISDRITRTLGTGRR